MKCTSNTSGITDGFDDSRLDLVLLFKLLRELLGRRLVVGIVDCYVALLGCKLPGNYCTETSSYNQSSSILLLSHSKGVSFKECSWKLEGLPRAAGDQHILAHEFVRHFR